MAKKKATLKVQGIEIRFYKEKDDDFISLTDIAKKFNERTDQIISNWLRTRSTVNFLGAWELLHNASFNPLNFEGIKNQTGEPTFVLSVKDWIEQTEAIGIRAKAGRYGGTYAHKDIAFEFLSYLSPTFKLYVFKEFQRLKIEESERNQAALQWNLNRVLSKINYRIHTDAIKENLIPKRITSEGIVYANEADILNVALFGKTAKMWRSENPEAKGNIRDYATTEQLLVLANLEVINAELISAGLGENERATRLNESAINQIRSLINASAIKNLPGYNQK